MRSTDWAKTPVGSPETWPQSLRTAVSILLESRFPMYIAWGPKFVQFYNDGYRPVLGSTKHPAAMGLGAQTTFAESWQIIGPMFEGVRKGTAVGSENWMLPLDRHGYLEECYFTFSYSPIRDESGSVGGILVTVTETTARVLSERRLRTLRDLAARSGVVKREDDAWKEAARALEGNAFDLPFALLYRSGEALEPAALVATSGWTAGASTAAAQHLTPVPETPGPELVSNARARFGDLPAGPWPDAPHSALVLPISRAGAEQPYGFLVAGLSARRALDDDYRGFLALVADHISTTIGNARGYEEEKQLAEALAEIDRAKTAFFINVSHEFRTPLTLMLGPIEDGLADEEEPLSARQRERQEMARRNGLRLQKLVNTLLDFARIETGRAQASFVPTDLAAFTIDLASSFDSAMTAAGLKLVVDCPPLPEAVYVDPAMWEKVVLNLLSNALKFTFKGEVCIALKWLGAQVELSVRDTGTGIPDEEQSLVFKRFHRVEGARGRSHEGSGIGLALVQELAGLHGGTVTVTSAVGKGSTFSVRLPTGVAHLPKEQVGVARTLTATGIGPGSFLAEVSQWNEVETPDAAPSATRSKARILVADDNADMRTYLGRLLSAHWKVETVSDGAPALAAAQANPPDLILSDVMMPGLGGLQLVRALRADERTRSIPVLLLSARAGEEATIEGLTSGADGYLVKPFSAKELIARVDSLLTVSELRQAAIRTERTHGEDARRLLEESRRATKSREETLAVVSHDLRSPLAVIRTSAERLERISAEGESKVAVLKQTAAIQRSVDRMNRLIGDLLDLASIDAGTLSIEARPHTADELVRDCQELFEPRAHEKGVQLTSEVEAQLSVECDKERILQALGNLVSNAIKFTPSGGRVRIGAEANPGTGDIRFSVSDTGVGIPADARPQIFDRFWHGATKNRDGHGLGLSIARGIVESHGGRIEVDSVPGAGSTFWFTLPREHTASAVASPPPARTGIEENFIQAGGEMGALIRSVDWSQNSLGRVEDWPQSLRTSVSTMLRSPYPIILFWGPEKRMLYNDAFRPILGAKHPGTLGARAHEALVEEWALLGPLMQRVLDTGEPLFIQNGNVNFERRPGGLREEAYFTWSYNPTIGEDGEIAGLFAIASETTRQVVGDRRLAILRELSIRASLSKKVDEIHRSLEGVLAQAGNDLPFALLYLVDGDKAQLVSCAGLTREAPAAPGSIAPGDRSPWPLEAVARSGHETLVEGLDAKLGKLPGGPWPEPATRALVLPVPIGSGKETTAVLVAGLSPLLALDDEYRGFLQLLARQLTASISSARAFEHEKKRAEELAQLDQAKTAFFSNVSHEFRTPLMLILGPIEDALARTQKSLEGEKLELVRRNALRLYKMVNTLLDFSRMEAGRAQATYVPTDLSAFTRNLASTFESTVQGAELRFIVACEALPEAIYVDPEMWEKIVLNLLSNALKYTHQGEIRVGLQWQDEEAVLTVQDTGVGIPADELPRLFERFYRVRATEGRSYEGTGIGLALVQELVKLHGGTVAVKSTLGEGTTFTVRLPRGVTHLPKERIERSSRPRTSAAGAAPFLEEAQRWSSNSTMARAGADAADGPRPEVPAELLPSRILLVDDNLDLRGYVAGLLREIFPNVEMATNGIEALERVRAQMPDLVLSDVMMPGLDGFGLVRELRADARTRAIPIILLSARAGDEPTVEGLRSGADDYLVKPFSARELIARVRTQLEMARVRREAARQEGRANALRAAVEMRDEFLTAVSHELRTPLTALGLQADALVRALEHGEGALLHKAETVRGQGRRLAELVEILFDASTLDAGMLQLHFETLDLAAPVRAAVERLELESQRAGTVVTVRTEPVVGGWDGGRVKQVLTTLLRNAFKFGAKKPIDVSVEKTPGGARIEVRDRGIGIAPEELERIFGRFERGIAKRNYGGLGLGLWISRSLIEAMNGTIRVESTLGVGSTFIIELPVR